jgi:nucleoid DNA-binding protein
MVCIFRAEKTRINPRKITSEFTNNAPKSYSPITAQSTKQLDRNAKCTITNYHTVELDRTAAKCTMKMKTNNTLPITTQNKWIEEQNEKMHNHKLPHNQVENCRKLHVGICKFVRLKL